MHLRTLAQYSATQVHLLQACSAMHALECRTLYVP